MLDVDAQTEYWNRIGPTKPFSHPLAIDRLSHWLPASAQIVDIGCGYGRTLNALASTGYRRVVGVDPAPAMAVAARARGVPAPIIVGDARFLPLRDRCADAALLLAVLTCIPTDEGQRGVLAEIRRILRAGSLLYISDLWLQTDRRNRARYDRDAERFGRYGVFALDEGVVVRHHDPAWIESLTAEFSTVELRPVNVVTMNGNIANGFQWTGRTLT
jgi:SAM-dependent methyltransferase